MTRRNERRERIESAFSEFRHASAQAMGAAANRRAQAEAAHARKQFALDIMRTGIMAARSDDELLARMRAGGYAELLAQASVQRDRIFEAWTSTGTEEITDLVAEASPGSAGLPWQDWLGHVGTHNGFHQDAPVPELWRVGTGTIPTAPLAEEFPVAFPLLEQAHLYLNSGRSTPARAEALVEMLLLRVLSHFRPGLVHIHVWDFAQLTGSLPGLYPLAKAGLLTAHDPSRLDGMLDELSEHIRRIHKGVLVDGHPTLEAVTAVQGRRTEPWRIGVLFGNGTPPTEDQSQKLRRVARNGLACGIQLIMVDIPVDVANSVESIVLLGRDQDKREIAKGSMVGPHGLIYLDDPLPREEVPKACAALADAMIAQRSRVRSFADLLPASYWTESSAVGLSGPVGFEDGEPVDLHLGDSSPHALIGGPSGSGKTNFLYAMLGGLAARYNPDELELYLLDFKEGVSFAQFTPGRKDPSWMPHARLVGVNVNEDREFGVALLRFLADEMRRRADAAKRHEVTKLEELREEDPDGRWPRIVAVIDEFQYLFAERDAVTSQATQLLEDVARRGRSQGIHLVLASQDVSGIEAFWGKPAIFEQFTLRVALPKARRVLADTNRAAIELPRWHAVLNHESGVQHGNKLAKIPDATAKKTFDALQLELWQREHGQEKPILFDGSRIPELSAVEDFRRLRLTGEQPPSVLLGQVIDVEGSAARMRLSAAPGRNIAVLGSAQQDACSVLSAAALSLAKQYRPGECTFTVASMVEATTVQALALQGELTRQGHVVESGDLESIRGLLATRAAAITERMSGTTAGTPAPHFLVLYAVDGAHTVLEAKDPTTRQSGVDDLRKILKNGPEFSTHTIGWWRSVARLKTSLGMGPVDDIGTWVAFDVQGQDLNALAAGQLISWSPRVHRGLFFDRFEHARPEVLIPYDTASAMDEQKIPLQPTDTHPYPSHSQNEVRW
ncbi:cell division protein FtsK [Pseudonocardiaceae bacterium YIM PH 21723]|nr:cell division protein FtsK [Pseudonocardiaceae bacterium YIM PH 21723]